MSRNVSNTFSNMENISGNHNNITFSGPRKFNYAIQSHDK